MLLKVFIYSEMSVGNLLNKSNAPYLIAGTFATLALIASGTLAIAPYVGFLSSIAVFNIALPVALSVSALSALVLILSCKMISKNRKIEAERSKFAEKEEELAKKDSRIQELESENTELSMRVGQLECEKTNSLHYTEELRDENKRLKEKKGNLQGQLCKVRDELDSLKREYNDLVCTLGSQHTASEEREKLLGLQAEEIRRLETQLRKKDGEISSVEESLEDFKKEKTRLEKRVKQLEERLNSKTQKVEQLAAEKEKLLQGKELSENKINNLERCLHQKKEKLREVQDDNSRLINSRKDLSGECQELYKQNSVLKKEVKDLQEKVNQSEMQSESSYSAFLDISNGNLPEFEGVGENKFANEQFLKPRTPVTSTPMKRTPSNKREKVSAQESLNISTPPIADITGIGVIDNSILGESGQNVPGSQDPRNSPGKKKGRSPKKENKENSGPQINKGPDTSIKSPGSSPLKETTNIVGLNVCTGGA